MIHIVRLTMDRLIKRNTVFRTYSRCDYFLYYRPHIRNINKYRIMNLKYISIIRIKEIRYHDFSLSYILSYPVIVTCNKLSAVLLR